LKPPWKSPLDTTRLDVEAVLETLRLVLVAPVNIELVACRIEAKREVEVELVNVPFVVLNNVVKKEVVVAFVPVAFTKVKFWRVVEPATNKSPKLLIVVVAVPPIYRVSETDNCVEDA
jgi:hypothetical protein